MGYIAPWLDNSHVEGNIQRVIRRALCDVGIRLPLSGQFRHPRLDYYATTNRAPLGSPYGGLALSLWSKFAGCWTPPLATSWWRERDMPAGNPLHAADWYRAAKSEGRLHPKVGVGTVAVEVDSRFGYHVALVVSGPDGHGGYYRTFEANMPTTRMHDPLGDAFHFADLDSERQKSVVGYITLERLR